MNYIDIIIAAIVVIFGIIGLRKGLIREAATLVGLFLGLWVAFHFSDFTADKLQHLWEIDPKYLNLIAFIVTFIVVTLLVKLLGNLVAIAMEGDFVVPWRWIGFSILISLAVSLLSGILPARRAAALDPIRALHSL